MKITPQTRFSITNILFFGIVGSLLSGILPAIVFSLSGHEPNVHLLNQNKETLEITSEINYIFFSLAIGFLPTSITGYLYSKMYQNEFKKTGVLDFWKEIKLAAIAARKTIFWFYAFFAALAIVALALMESKFNYTLVLAAFIIITCVFLLVWILAAISAMVCANLISEWNEKQFDNL